MEWDWNSPQVENYFRDHQIQRLLQIFSIWKELELIWIHPKSRSSILFLAFRYFSLASNLIVTAFLGLDNWSIEVCSHYSLFRQVILFVSQAAVCSLLTLRLYALYACDKRVLVLYAITAVTAVALAGIWMVLFFYDAAVFFLTAHRTYWYWRRCQLRLQASSYSRLNTGTDTLLSLMFRDGAMYFAVIAVANLTNILTFLLSGCISSDALSPYVKPTRNR
ncbi:hypothetical protein WG66_001279 [Moniliophthora roreri]|nr:hypothetical protein WG66_001279 [Moniliophthora roreri]